MLDYLSISRSSGTGAENSFISVSDTAVCLMLVTLSDSSVSQFLSNSMKYSAAAVKAEAAQTHSHHTLKMII